MKNKIISLEGTDCSGKTTQHKLLIERLLAEGHNIEQLKFPNYQTATGRIIADCYLGQNGKTAYFSEGASKVNPRVSGLYYAADRLYNLELMQEKLSRGHLFLDRYVESNLAFMAGKHLNSDDRIKTYQFFEELEYELLKLPKPDIKILLHMPTKYANVLKAKRAQTEVPDEHESDDTFRENVERAYLEVAKRHDFYILSCVKDNEIRSINDIHEELYSVVITQLGL